VALESWPPTLIVFLSTDKRLPMFWAPAKALFAVLSASVVSPDRGE
jgi:hypothetical protein